MIYIDDGDTPTQSDGSVPMLLVHINDCCEIDDTPKTDGASGW